MTNNGKIIVTLLLPLLAGCAMSTSEASADEEAKELKRAEVAEQVKCAVEDSRFYVDVRQMYPQSAPARTLTSAYSFEMRGDSVISFLPYYGRAYSVPYGGGKGLNFTATMSEYDVERGDECWNVTIDVKNEEDNYRYFIVVFDNAATTIDVLSNQREAISYSGVLDH